MSEASEKVRFKWGTFCRRAVSDASSGMLTMVDVLPSLMAKGPVGPVAPEVPTGPEDASLSPINMGMLAAVVLFERTGPVDNLISIPVSCRLIVGQFELPQRINLSLNIEEGRRTAYVVVAIEPPILPVLRREGLTDIEAKFIVYEQDTEDELGSINMQITTEFTKVEQQ